MTPIFDASDRPVRRIDEDPRTRVPKFSEEFIAYSTQADYSSYRYLKESKQIFLSGLINSRRMNYTFGD
jgi:hypothetical protein